MAHYTVKFSCGHEADIQLFGNTASRERKIRYYEESGLCPACYKKQLEESKRELASNTAKMADDLGLPKLNGSEKQIAWADKIRVSLISDADEAIDGARWATGRGWCDEEKHQRCEKVIEFATAFSEAVGSETSASVIIGWRDADFRVLESVYLDNLKDIESGKKVPNDFFGYGDLFVRTLKLVYGEEEPQQKAIILAPDHKESDVLVNVTYADRQVVVDSPKDSGVISAAKACGFHWDAGAWRCTIGPRTGSAEDRASEIANKLLIAGYQVSVPKEIKDIAVSGSFEPRCTRWITAFNDDSDHVYVTWERGDDMYSKALDLTGAKWRSGYGMSVPASSADEVEDFAQMYGYRITPGAQGVMDAFRSKVAIVAPKPGKNEEKKDGKSDLDGVLSSSRDVIEDLKDD